MVLKCNERRERYDDRSEKDICSLPQQQSNQKTTIMPKFSLRYLDIGKDWTFHIASHILFGLHPVFSRLLQHAENVSHITEHEAIPTLALMSMSNLLALFVYLPFMFNDFFSSLLQAPSMQFLRWLTGKPEWYQQELQEGTERRKFSIVTFAKRYLFSWVIWLFAITLIIGSAARLYAARYTNANYVQLVSLSSPFTVAVLSYFFVKEETKFSIFRVLAVIVTVIGAVMIVLGGNATSFFSFNLTMLGSELTYQDAIGMMLSLLSSILLAANSVVLRFSSISKNELHKYSSETFYYLKKLVLAFGPLIPSLILEDWSAWLKLTLYQWLIFIAFSLLLNAVASYLQIYAIAKLGASTVMALQSIRLVASILFSMVFINEYLDNFLQVIGTLLVVVGVFFYSRNKKASIAKSKAEASNSVIVELEPSSNSSQNLVLIPHKQEEKEVEYSDEELEDWDSSKRPLNIMKVQ